MLLLIKQWMENTADGTADVVDYFDDEKQVEVITVRHVIRPNGGRIEHVNVTVPDLRFGDGDDSLMHDAIANVVKEAIVRRG